MTDDRKTAAIKGWQTRHARQRMLKDALAFADEKTALDVHLQYGVSAQAIAQDYANASPAQNKYVTLQEAERVYQQNEEPEARKDRLAKLKAWWRWFYHGE